MLFIHADDIAALGMKAGDWVDLESLHDDEVKRIVADSAEFAQTSPEPDESELWTDVLLEAR